MDSGVICNLQLPITYQIKCNDKSSDVIYYYHDNIFIYLVVLGKW